MPRTLFDVATDGDLARVHTLLQAGTPVDQAESIEVATPDGGAEVVTGVTPLMRAAAEGHADVVAALLAAGADPNHRSSDRWTPLLMAAISETPAVAQLLVQAGAAVDARNDREETAFWLAAEGEDVDTAAVLADAGADLDAADVDGTTALMALAGQPVDAMRGSLPVVMVRWLLARGADPTRRDAQGKTALDHEMLADQQEVMRVLLGIG